MQREHAVGASLAVSERAFIDLRGPNQNSKTDNRPFDSLTAVRRITTSRARAWEDMNSRMRSLGPYNAGYRWLQLDEDGLT
jgi:hypothetical protein